MAIGSKWVCKVKLNPDDSVDRYKARLIAKGFHQVEGIDYFDSFSPVAKIVTVRIFLAIATSKSWPIHQLDINNAFLHGYLDEDIYMQPPEGHTSNSFVALLVYVDDVLLTGTLEADIISVKQHLDKLFTIKDLGCAKYFLGLEIASSSSGIVLNQRKYILDILTDTGLVGAKPTKTPFPKGQKLCANKGPPLAETERYRRFVERLLYLNISRTYISYSVQQLSQFVNSPCQSHWEAAMHLLRYLKSCHSKGLFYPTDNSLHLEAFSDVDWASCSETRKSLTSFCISLGLALISWKTKKQTAVSRSSAEVEYRSLAATVCELQWISYVLKDFGIQLKLSILLWCDNQAALHITVNPVFRERTKHLDIDCHLVREQFKQGCINPQHISTHNQVVDVFTKPLFGP
ncbi:PREDICTED: uncharacterized protein LOC109115144 [Nelumbo nucifera]|uniref:Uncharacterized protein LOC109115144 n=1 Tax=Nelumbo nucifera TaxID=4432 RepID=A0A1U8Q8I0_NELNU|nr:PREDICTED: uncharacterized protein LOC109115144 [Nelumbo nucifera]